VSKIPKFGLNFRPRQPLKRSGFETKQNIGYLKQIQSASMTGLWSPQIWFNFVNPTSKGYKFVRKSIGHGLSDFV